MDLRPGGSVSRFQTGKYPKVRGLLSRINALEVGGRLTAASDSPKRVFSDDLASHMAVFLEKERNDDSQDQLGEH